jgi:Arc/MetJ family transcription regulator
LNAVYNTALILLREVAMSVRLNITMDDDVYARLKKEVPPKKLSAFIAGAVRAKLHPDAKALNAAYQAASKERWRASFDEDWKHIDEEGWPK